MQKSMTSAATAQSADTQPDSERWQAVRDRDRRADDRFVYSVRTTGVYCRPSCGARTPKRENVAFHENSAAAEAAGFRACRRCHPKGISISQTQAEIVAEACRVIERAESVPSLASLADRAKLSPWHFHRLFRRVTGLTPRDYAAGVRTGRLKSALMHDGTVTEAIYESGYGSSGRFYAASAGEIGMTPTALRRGGAGETLRFAVGTTTLGEILVAASDRGIVAIELGDDADGLVRRLQDRFPNANLVGADPSFEGWVSRVVAAVERPDAMEDLPLDIRGTAFQREVWAALSRIPLGSTASYADIARRLGRPKAVRAVAQACAANRIALAIPCHRVVRTDGGLSGYRWGVARKSALLEREARPDEPNRASAADQAARRPNRA